MKTIFLTGHSGFVGTNFIEKFSKQYEFRYYSKNKDIDINDNIVLHFAGKAHDLKNTSNKSIYYEVNTELTKKIFDAFLQSKASVFITLSSVKAVADVLNTLLTEDHIPNPATHYGKSKLLAEEYILNKQIPIGKKFYILRPCMIHGKGNKGNLNTLLKYIKYGYPWPLGCFHNKRSYCSVDNLLFVINELIIRQDIPSGVYNICDDDPISTIDIIKIINEQLSKNTLIFYIPKVIIFLISNICTLFKLPFNKHDLDKLTENYIVSNKKIKHAIGKPFPINSIYGMKNTVKSFIDESNL